MTDMKLFLEDGTLSEGISRLLGYGGDTEIGLLTDEISELCDAAENLEKYSERTVKDCIREIYDLTEIDTRDSELEMADVLYLIYQEVECLSDKLGIDLEDPMTQPNRSTILNEEKKQQSRSTISKDKRLLKILKNISEYAYTEDKHIKETLDARLMNDYLELADILDIDPEKYII